MRHSTQMNLGKHKMNAASNVALLSFCAKPS